MVLSSLKMKLTGQSVSDCFKIVWLVRRDGQASHPGQEESAVEAVKVKWSSSINLNLGSV